MTNIRYLQRFENYEKAFLRLKEVCEDANIKNYSNLEKEGVIQRFEFTIELAWKLLKDYLQHNEVLIAPISPANVIKTAARDRFLEIINIDGDIFFDMIKQRNEMSHSYDEEKFEKIFLQIIEVFYAELRNLYLYFKQQSHN